MTDTIRIAREEDLGRILELYARARVRMTENGNPNQWGTSWPEEWKVREDMENRRLYVICRGNTIRGVFCLLSGGDPTYRQIEGGWHSDCSYCAIHRIAGEGGGIFAAAVEYAERFWPYLRVDTHEKNTAMRRAILRQGFSYCGMIRAEDGTLRLAFDRLQENGISDR